MSKHDCDFYYFKPKGKWKYHGEGNFPVDPKGGYRNFDREFIRECNGGDMPGISGTSEDMIVVVAPRDNCESQLAYPHLLLNSEEYN